MKLILPILVLLLPSYSAWAYVPKCVGVGTRSEGWLLKNGQIQWDNCKNKVAVCTAAGSKSEGWYTAEVTGLRRLASANCSAPSTYKPQCVNMGSKSEGWTLPDGTIAWGECAQKVVRCLATGSKSEGWYALSVGAKSLLTWDRCSSR